MSAVGSTAYNLNVVNNTLWDLKSSFDAKETNDINEVNVFFLLWAAVTVFFMQAGFGMLEVGSVRAKNAKNILLKNMLDACIGALVWYLIGFGIAYGDSDDGGFMGTGADGFALHPDDAADDYTANGYDWVGWFFQYAFAAACATIVSGAVAERAQIGAYLVYTTVITAFIYPVVVHWIWDGEGFLSAFNSNEGDKGPVNGGMMDFAGSGVVHMTGGVAAFVGAAVIGPRKGRFVDGKVVDIPAHSAVLGALGTFILWFGWYGFNCGSTLGIHTYGRDAARVAVTTTICPAACALTCVIFARITTGVWDLGVTCNGVLAGLVSITAGCPVMQTGTTAVTGILGAFIYIGASKALKKCKVDDPLDAFPVHGACGMWGCIAVGLFATEDYTYNLEGKYGLFTGGDGTVLGVQIVGTLCIFAWTSVTCGIMFGILKATGMLRVPEAMEDEGMDTSKHGGAAYNHQEQQPTTMA